MSLTDDVGNGDVPASQPADVTHKRTGRTIHLRSFFEPARVIAVGGIRPEDLRDLASELDRLTDNPCYDLTVRPRVTGAGLLAAFEHCDLVFVVAHGSREEPYLTVGGLSNHQLDEDEAPTADADRVWFASCFGREIVDALGPPFETLPADAFDDDGTCGRNTMIRGLVQALRGLQDTECELPTDVCVLAGVQEVHFR